MNKKLLGLGMVGVGLLSLATALPSMADPNGAPTYRALAGVGSDTTQGVVNGLSEVVKDGSGTKLIASYDATGSATIATQAAAACQSVARPNGSGAGVTALAASVTAKDGCIQFARSSSGPSSSSPTGYTWIPFATDAVTYAVTATSSIPRTLTKADLVDFYTCGPKQQALKVIPELPQAGSGTRKFWLSYLGITEGQQGSCVIDHQGTTLFEEHDGRNLTDNAIMPLSIAQYIAQMQGTLADIRGREVLGTIDGTAPVLLNGSFAVTRNVYNVVPTTNLSDPTVSNVFVGANSQVCSAAGQAVIKQYGFGANANCGSTATSH